MNIEVNSVYSFNQLGKRTNQEDARYPDEDKPDGNPCYFVVCDGVGGLEEGEVASRLVCKSIRETMQKSNPEEEFSEKDFIKVLNKAYEDLDNYSLKSKEGMGTTLTFLTLHAGGAFAAHIGDSRIYQIRPGEGIIYRSEDHSLVNSLLRSGNLSPFEVKNHPKSNIIMRCMTPDSINGKRDKATVINLQDIKEGDYFLLCTDGVIQEIEEEELIDLYSSNFTDKDKIETIAEKSSLSSDNNTLIQIHIGKVTIPFMEEMEDFASAESIQTQGLKKKENSIHDVASDYKKLSKLQKIVKQLFPSFFFLSYI